MRLTLAGTPVDRLEEDMVDIPDLAQTFVVTCCLMNIPFRFTGLQSLKIKETDRITALIAELRKLGYAVRSEQDSILLWEGERCPAESAPLSPPTKITAWHGICPRLHRTAADKD